MTDKITPEEQAQIDTFRKMFTPGSFNSYEEERSVVRDPKTERIIKDFRGDGSDDQLTVEFTVEQVYSPYQTFLNNGIPTFVDIEHIKIYNVNENPRLTQIHTPVTDYYKWRFPREYAAFKAGKTLERDGTPLIDWKELSAGNIKELNQLGVVVVEQIAALSDTTTGSLRPYARLRDKAKAFLDSRKDVNAEAHLDKKIGAETAKRDAEIEALKAQVEALVKLVSATAPKLEEDDREEVEEKPKMRFGKPIKPKNED